MTEENKKETSVQTEENKTQDMRQKSAQKNEKEKSKDKEETSKSVPVNMKKMSDLEAKKWLKIMQKSQKGHLYKMQDLEHEEDENEKPW